MVIKVKVQTHAKFERVEEVGLEQYKVWTTATPEDNKANEAVIELLADYFNTSPSYIRILSGNKSTHKMIEIQSRE